MLYRQDAFWRVMLPFSARFPVVVLEARNVGHDVTLPHASNRGWRLKVLQFLIKLTAKREMTNRDA